MDGTVALSLERSVTQVALSDQAPVNATFRGLIDQQRALSDRLFDETAAAVAAIEFLPTRDAFATAVRDARAAINALRQEADAMLAVDGASRDAARVAAVPSAIKTAVVNLRRTADLLQLDNQVTSQFYTGLSNVQSRAWQVREFGGRARTYYAIAVLHGAVIPEKARGEIFADASRANEAWAAIENAFNALALPEDLRAQADAAGELYFQTYRATLADLDAAMATASGAQTEYAMSFEAFFEHSNDALGSMVALAGAAGDAMGEHWAERRSTAWNRLIVDAAAAAFLALSVLIAVRLVLRRVVSRLAHVTELLTAASTGERCIEIDARKNDLREIEALHAALERFQSARAEAEAAKEAAERRAQEERAAAMGALWSTLGGVVDAAVVGDFSHRAPSNFQDAATNQVCDGMNRLLTTIGENLTATSAALNRVVDGDLQQTLNGEFHGAFDSMRRDVNAMIEQLSTLIGQITATTTAVRADADAINARADAVAGSSSRQVAALSANAEALAAI